MESRERRQSKIEKKEKSTERRERGQLMNRA